MTPDELETAVLDGDTVRVIASLSAATEAERLACGARMVSLRKEYGDWPAMASDPATNATTLIALLATGTAAQIRGGRRMWRHDAAATMLRLRPSALLVELVPWMLERMGWSFVRALVRDGTIPRPSSDAYIVGMLDGFVDVPVLLRDDPGLLDHEIWRIFEVEGTGDHSLADHDKYMPEAKSWTRALLDLAGTRLDRGRLLDASLAALERDFPAFRAGWFSRFHEALTPTPAERATRIDAYLRLLRSPIAPTVTLAVRALAEIHGDGPQDGERLLAHIEPAMTARAAGTARDALRLVERVVRADPTLSGAARRPVAAALAHRSADVQAAAVSLFEGRLGPVDDDTAGLLTARRGDVAASVRPRLDALLTGRRDAPGAAGGVGQPARAPVPVPGETRAADRWDPFDALIPVTPVGSVEELVELLAGVLEREGPPEHLEIALDGVLRLCGERPPDFLRLTRAVRVRSERLLAGRREPGIATWFASLVRSWVDGTLPIETRPMPGALAECLARRVRGVAREAAAGRARPLVALPSYVGGWIEPVDLVTRLTVGQHERGRPGPAMVSDVAHALLRVLPVRRDNALAAAGDLTGEIGDAVRHALGGVGPVGRTSALWAAAARCRTPDGDDPEVARVHPGLGPDGALAGRYTLVIGEGRYGRQPRLEGGVVASDPADDAPAGLLWRTSAHVAGSGKDGPLVDWVRLIWPQDRRSWFAVSAALLLDNLDWWEARWHDRQRLEALFEPWTPLGREAATLLAVALQAREPGQRGLAVDAASDAIGHGRISAELVVRGFDEVATAVEAQPASPYPITLFRPGRLALSLDEIARHSDRHRAWALDVAVGALVRIRATSRPRPVPIGQVAPLLRLLVELVAAPGSGIPEVARATLHDLARGSGEAARLARRLLTAAPADEATPRVAE